MGAAGRPGPGGIPLPPPSPPPCRPPPEVALEAAGRGGVAEWSRRGRSPGRAGVVAAHSRVSRVRGRRGGAALRRGAGGGRRDKGVGPAGRPSRSPGFGSEDWSAARTTRRSGAPAGFAPEMPVRGDRGFPPRRELSGWLRVSARSRRLGGEKTRGMGVGARGGQPLLSHLRVGPGPRGDFTRAGGGSWPPGLLDPLLSSLKSLGFQIKWSGRVGDRVLNSALDLCYLEGISSCLSCSLPSAFVSSSSVSYPTYLMQT